MSSIKSNRKKLLRPLSSYTIENAYEKEFGMMFGEAPSSTSKPILLMFSIVLFLGILVFIIIMTRMK